MLLWSTITWISGLRNSSLRRLVAGRCVRISCWSLRVRWCGRLRGERVDWGVRRRCLWGCLHGLLLLISGHYPCLPLRGGYLRLSRRGGLGSSFPCCLLDPIPGHIGSWILLREKIQVLLSDRELAMRGSDISVLHILGVQGTKLPVSLLLLLLVLETCDLSEDRHLLNEVLEGSGMN